MRSLVACLAVLLAATPMSIPAESEPRDSIAISLFGFDGSGTFVAWTPVLGAIGYDILRGPSPESAVLIGHSTTNLFVDPEPSEEDTWYVVLSVHPQSSGFDTLSVKSRGTCFAVAPRGATIYAWNCVPIGPA